MAHTDALLKLSAAQAVTTTAVSTNNVNAVVARDLGVGDLVPIATFTVDTAVTSGGSYTVTFEVITDDNSAFSSPTVIASSGAIPQANLTKGCEPIHVAFNPSVLAPLGEQYIAVRYTTSGTLTAGAFTCYLGNDNGNANKFYPVGYTIL